MWVPSPAACTPKFTGTSTISAEQRANPCHTSLQATPRSTIQVMTVAMANQHPCRQITHRNDSRRSVTGVVPWRRSSPRTQKRHYCDCCSRRQTQQHKTRPRARAHHSLARPKYPVDVTYFQSHHMKAVRYTSSSSPVDFTDLH